VKKLGEKEAWAYLRTDEIFRYLVPYYPRNGKSYGFQIWLVYSFHSVNWNKIPWKILEKGARGRIQGLPIVFGYPPIISGKRVKLRISNSACTFTGSIGTKAH